MKKCIALLCALLLLVSLLAACSAKPADGTTEPAKTDTSTADTANDTENKTDDADNSKETEAAGSDLRVAMVCSGSLGDTGIFDMGEAALVQAGEDFGISYNVLEGKDDPSLYYELLQTAAADHDLVFVNPGYQFDSYLEEMADTYPNVLFVYADGTSSIERDNIISVSYQEHEGSYLAGVMAAMMTTRTDYSGINEDKVLGFVGAMDSPTINNFLTGFEQGAASVDPEIKVLSMYVGSYNDPALGKEMALSLYDQGCDIIYAAASNSGDGVSAAAKEKGFYCIGVDTDKSSQAPENIMGSMLKNVTISFYDVIKACVNGEKIETVQRKGLADKWVEMYFIDSMRDYLPDDVLTAMDEAEQGIISGTITVQEFQ